MANSAAVIACLNKTDVYIFQGCIIFADYVRFLLKTSKFNV